MSIELFGTPSPRLTVTNIQCLMDSIAEFNDIVLVRRDESELGIGFPDNENTQQETATITFMTDQVYLGFHACHKVQREKVVHFIESILRQVGCVCQLNEE